MESKPKEDISDTLSNGSSNDEVSTTSNEVEYTEEELKKAEEFKEKGN